MEKKISIIIPTYAPQDYLWECMDSLERQTLGKEQFDVWLILNGDKLPYYSLLQERLKSYAMEVHLLYCDQRGVSAARNLGINHSQGEYLCFIDDDDLVSDTYLELLLEHSSSNGIAASNVVAFKDELSHKESHYLTDAYSNYDERRKYDLVRHRSFLSTAWCKLIPRELVGDFRFDTHLAFGEDAFFMFKLSPSIQQISITPERAIYYVRKRETSASRSKSNRRVKRNTELRLLAMYTKEYVAHHRKYSFLLYVTRIMATVYKLTWEHIIH